MIKIKDFANTNRLLATETIVNRFYIVDCEDVKNMIALRTEDGFVEFWNDQALPRFVPVRNFRKDPVFIEVKVEVTFTRAK